ncbi:MAG: YidC/Oxa1 family membrane protein insertase [Patescibacteria group bacterium]
MFSFLYNEILNRPLLNLLVFLYNTVAFEDLGLAIIILTIIVRLILYPLFHKGAKHQMVMQRLQPKVKKIQDEHKANKEKQAEAMLHLYREHNVNPFSGFFILLVQLPILIALYRIFLNTLKPEFLDSLYPFVARPEVIHNTLFGLINLGESSILIVSLAALAQYFQGKLALWKKGEKPQTTQEKMAHNMVFVGPIITVVIFFNFPAAVALYWAATSLFSVFQQIIINRQLKNDGKFDQKNN